jgi:hypothetical protein
MAGLRQLERDLNAEECHLAYHHLPHPVNLNIDVIWTLAIFEKIRTIVDWAMIMIEIGQSPVDEERVDSCLLTRSASATLAET